MDNNVTFIHFNMSEQIKDLATILCSPTKDDRGQIIEIYLQIRQAYENKKLLIKKQFQQISQYNAQLLQQQQNESYENFQSFPSTYIIEQSQLENNELTKSIQIQKQIEEQAKIIISKAK